MRARAAHRGFGLPVSWGKLLRNVPTQEVLLKIRLAVLTAALSFGLASVASLAGAQENYPQRTIKIVVGFPPGVPADVLSRIIAPKLQDGLGQSVIVENKPGAGSSIGADQVAKSDPDGYTLYVSSIANTVNHNVSKLPFDMLKDFAPIAMVADVPGILVAHPSVPGTLKEFIAAAKAKPNEFSYGTSGPGTATHLYGELLNLNTGTKLVHVPYKGTSQTLTDLIAGRIHVMFTPASTVMAHVKAGTIKALAAMGQKRIKELPDLPTFAEAGIEGYEAGFWFGFNAPAKTPRPIIDRLNKELVKVLAMPDVQEKMRAQSIEPVSSTPEALADFHRRDVEKWGRVVKAAGVKQE
jgi:tripartite-type tricarboxylate transporter receptor subunit TctC